MIVHLQNFNAHHVCNRYWLDSSVDRTRYSHRRGSGSFPNTGKCFFFIYDFIFTTLQCSQYIYFFKGPPLLQSRCTKETVECLKLTWILLNKCNGKRRYWRVLAPVLPIWPSVNLPQKIIFKKHPLFLLKYIPREYIFNIPQVSPKES